MPRFDAIAGASLTPGGVQAGMNDLVAALVNGPIKRRQIEQQQAQIAQQNEFQNRSFGEQVAARMADDTRGDKSLDETVRHNQVTEGLARDGKLTSLATTAQEKKLKMAQAKAAAKMGAGFTASGKKLVPRKTYIAGIPTDQNESGIQSFDNGYDEGPMTAEESMRYNQFVEEEMNASGGVADIADQLGAPHASTNPGAQMPRAGVPGRPTPVQPARPTRQSVADLVPAGPAPMAAAAPAATPTGKTASRAQIAQIAAKNGKSLEEAMAKYQAAGYTITD